MRGLLWLLIVLFLGAMSLDAQQDAKREPQASPEISLRLASPAKPVVLLPVFVNGQGPFQFALDTGASLTILSTDLARTLGVESGEVKQGLGAGGAVAVSLAQVESLAVGPAKLEKIQVAATDLGPLSQAAGTRLDGIVGFNYLKNFKVTIDYPRKTLRLE